MMKQKIFESKETIAEAIVSFVMKGRFSDVNVQGYD